MALDIKQKTTRRVHTAMRVCENILVCCAYVVITELTATREYICTVDTQLSYRKSGSRACRPIFETMASGAECPDILCWEHVSDTYQESKSYYASCSAESPLVCESGIETENTVGETPNLFGPIKNESLTCVDYKYSKSKIPTPKTFDYESKTRDYSDVGTITYSFEKC